MCGRPAHDAGISCIRYRGLTAYQPLAGGQEIMLVDLDGTLCLRAPGGRSAYDETRVGEDLVNQPVLRTVCALAAAGIPPIFMSGRKETCRGDTERWLRLHCPVRWLGLFMRPAGDGRRDWQVKAELFDRHIRDRYHVVLVIDDRDQVVDMWRSIGLTTFQVADGDF